MNTVFAASAGVIATGMLLVWGLSLIRKDVSLVDIAWGPLFVAVALVTLAVTPASPAPSRLLLPLLTALWGLRLGLYLAIRKWGEGEDRRYQAMRDRRGDAFWWKSLYVVFLLQGVVLWCVALPLQIGIAQPTPGWTIGHVAGLALWTVGFAFEAIGDWQLARFRRDPANQGRVLDRGLWRYTRHPNYFGEACLWWGLGLIATAHGEHPWVLLSPLVMTGLLLRVSGVTLLESSLRVHRPGYEDYIRRTSAFVPWPPRQTTAAEAGKS